MRRSLSLVVALTFAPFVVRAQDPPRTIPEQSDHTKTSSPADTAAFLAACRALPHGDRLQITVAGSSHLGREQLLVHVRNPATATAPRLRALVIGDIHAGEVEGKEALQLLAREFAMGQHEALLERCELWLLPIYNIDGDADTGPTNRPGQNGPDVVGVRHNAQQLDLNRDFVKADAPETRTLLQLFATIDPHLFVDLHTTNGSYHGYHLTYSPSLSPNVDPGIAALTRTLLDAAQATMRSEHRFATFDYGNFETNDWDGGGAPASAKGVRGWWSYDHRARYGVNYFGLRNRLAVLSEAYSYADFATRIAATRAFVLSLLLHLTTRADEVLQVTTAADERLRRGEPSMFGFATTFAPPESLPVLVGAVDEIAGSGERPLRRVRKGDGTAETMPVFRAFLAKQQRPLPHAFAIVAPTAEVLDRLRRHGIEFRTVAANETVQAQRFAVTKQRKPKRPYQGHQELQLEGNWQPIAAVDLPAGAIVVPARQRLARLAATLLLPESEDSLTTWNFFEAQTAEHHPVLLVAAPQ